VKKKPAARALRSSDFANSDKRRATDKIVSPKRKGELSRERVQGRDIAKRIDKLFTIELFSGSADLRRIKPRQQLEGRRAMIAIRVI